MDEITLNNNFSSIYNKSYRLAAAVFMISNVMDQNEELKTKIKNLSLSLVSSSINLKDINFLDAKKLITDLEKNSLELMSLLDIASIAGMVSEMNAGILKEEFQSFISEISKFAEKSEGNKNVYVKSVFEKSEIFDINKIDAARNFKNNTVPRSKLSKSMPSAYQNDNGYKRKDLRKNTILDFIKGHNNVSIKDIIPNVAGCSEKTVQRELIGLIKEGKIAKTGERRWSKYSVV